MASTTPPKETSNTSIRIDLLGTSITLTADKDAEYLNRVLERFKLEVERTQQSTGLDNPLKIAILTGFLLYEKLQQVYDRQAMEDALHAHENQEIEAIALNSIARIDEILKNGA
jgi:hypothetical protein